MRLFGFEFVRKTEPEVAPSFAVREQDDGAVMVAAGGAFGTYVDLDGTVRTEAELVTKYREMSLQPEIDSAIDEIVNESISIDEDIIVSVILDNLDVTEKVKKAIREEFLNVLNILNFQKRAYEIYRRWYIDGRLYYHVIIDEKDLKSGIKEVRYIDPRKIRKIREIVKKRTPGSDGSDGSSVIAKTQNEYFMYNDRGFNYGNKVVGPATSGLKIAKDSIVHVTSGLTDTQGTMVLSYLHKAIKALNQLRTLEDALIIYRLARAPERRIWYIDVGNLPKMKAEQYVRDIMIKHKNRLIYDGATGEVRDDRKFMCYAMDTKIPLLDGRTLELQQIIEEYNAGKQNWVYSCDPVSGKFYPGPVSWAGVTKYDAEVVRVTFDNGKSVVCTPDHKFPVWNKGFIEAQHLTPEDSIIPGYRRKKAVMYKDGLEYEQIYKNDTKTWEFTHREVAKWKDSVGIREEFTFKDEYLSATKKIVHHKDFDGGNNNPENLIMMDAQDHMIYHKEIQSISYNEDIISVIDKCARLDLNIDQTLEYINVCIDLSSWKELNSNRNPKNRDIDNLIFTYKDLLRISRLMGHKSWKKYKMSYETFERTSCGKRRQGLRKGSEELNQLLSDIAKNREPFCKTWKVINPKGNIEIIENLSAFCRENNLNRSNIKGKYGSKGYRAEQLVNHRIISVEKISEKMTVGSMAIDLKETYHSHHTYLLDAGVYTKNTMLEDYWLPRREGGKGTEVTTLPGGQTLGEMDDVLYFQKKLYQTLNVPVNRLNSDALFSIGRATEVTRDEVKFSKFVSRLRGRFSQLFTELLEKQLVLKGIMSIEDWQNISPDIKYDFAKDNYFTELKDADVLQNRIQLYSTMDQNQLISKYFSHEFVRKNVFKQSDEQIEDMDEEIDEENKDPRWNMNQIEPGQDSFSQDQIEQQSGDDQQPSGDSQDKVAEAQKTVDRLSKLSKRSPLDQSKYQSAIQILARNKDKE